MGSKSKYDPETSPRIARMMCRLGAIDTQLAEALAVTRDTVMRWRRYGRMYKDEPDKHPKYREYEVFEDACRESKSVTNSDVIESLLETASGSEFVSSVDEIPLTYRGNAILGPDGKPLIRRVIKKSKIPGNVTAQIFWLGNRMPDDFKDVRKVEGSSGTGGGKEDPKEEDKQLSDDELLEIMKEIQNANIDAKAFITESQDSADAEAK